MSTKMTSTRPYLLRAFYEWIIDNHLTPYIVIDASVSDVMVPEQYIDKEGKITLNISPVATNAFHISNQTVEFRARFSGIARNIYAPIRAVEAVYAKENGRGIVFADDDYEEEDSMPQVSDGNGHPDDDGSGGDGSGGGSKKGRPNLRIVK